MSFTFTDIIYLGTATPGSGGGGSSLPDQTGNAGKFLTTDGTDASWSDKPLTNTATGYISLTIGGNAAYNGRSTNVGINSTASSGSSTAFGNSANCSGPYAIAIGASPVASKDYTIAIGNSARAEQIGSIQLGKGTNNETSTFCVGLVSDNVGTTVNYKLLDANGTIPTDRYTTTPSADGTYVPTLTISSGTPTRSWAAPSGGLPSQTGNSGKFLTTNGTTASWGNALTNKAGASNSLAIIGTVDTLNNPEKSMAIGSGATVWGYENIAIGYNAQARSVMGKTDNVAIGNYAVAGGSSGQPSVEYATAIGDVAQATANYAIQLGKGTNSTANTFSVGVGVSKNYRLLDSDGTIPTDRLTKANTTVTLAVADWSSNTQTVTVNGVTSTSVVLVAPAPSDTADYVAAGILCTSQTTNSLTFTATTTPTNAIDVNIVCL